MPVSLRSAWIALLAAVAAAAPARADLLIDSFDSDILTASVRAAGSSPLAVVTVNLPMRLDGIGVRVDLDTIGAIRFVVFDVTHSSLLFASGPQTFADDGISYKVSAPFAALQLEKDIVYAIGGIADVGGRWSFDIPPATDDVAGWVRVAGDANANVTDFDAPTVSSFAGANVHVQLFGNPAPEPSSVALLGIGALALPLRRRRPDFAFFFTKFRA